MNYEHSNGVKHLLFFAAVWWLLSKGSLDSWVIGIVVVPFGAWLSVTWFGPAIEMQRNTKISLIRLILFIPFFLLQSLRGGWDTARLAMRPSLPVKPGFINYRIQLTSESARLFLLHVVSLLPGTVSVDLQGSCMRVHALDVSSQIEDDLGECERRVARLFKLDHVDLDGSSGGAP